MQYSFDDFTVSDLHKDAYGYRPTADWWAQWKSQTPEEKQQDWDYMCLLLQQNEEAERKAQAAAHARWSAHIDRLMLENNIDRATALRWDMEAMDCVGDAGFYCYHWGISYDYEDEINAVIKENV